MITAEQRQQLIQTATTIKQQAYAPYSNYLVGAAILADDGQIYSGVNVENASYGLTVCAERTAVFKMVTAGSRRLLAVAVSTANGGSPCGACRQVLVEFGDDVPVYLCDGSGRVTDTTLHTLLPHHFGPEHLTHNS